MRTLNYVRKRGLALFVALVVCLGLSVTAFADTITVKDTDDEDDSMVISFTSGSTTLQESQDDQVFTIQATAAYQPFYTMYKGEKVQLSDEDVNHFVSDIWVDVSDGLEIVGVSSPQLNYSRTGNKFHNQNYSSAHYTDLGTITIKIPGGTPSGTYTVQLSGMLQMWYSGNYGTFLPTVAYGRYSSHYAGTVEIDEEPVTFTLNIEPAPVVEVESVTLDREDITLTVGDEPRQLTATVTPDNATDKTVTWSSDNEAVATVDQNGNVTAVAAGNTTITATAGGQSASCAVTVNDEVVPPQPGNPTAYTVELDGGEETEITKKPGDTAAYSIKVTNDAGNEFSGMYVLVVKYSGPITFAAPETTNTGVTVDASTPGQITINCVDPMANDWFSDTILPQLVFVVDEDAADNAAAKVWLDTTANTIVTGYSNSLSLSNAATTIDPTEWTINVENKVKVTFAIAEADADKGTINGTDSFDVSYGGTLSETAPTVDVSDTHYTFGGWYNGENEFSADTTYSEDVTYTAKFNPATYTVTKGEGSEAWTGDETATYGQLYTGTLDNPDTTGAYTYTVSYTVGGGEAQTAPVENGSFTIPADAVEGDLVITVIKQSAWSVEVHEDYAGGNLTLVLVKTGDQYENAHFTYDGHEMIYTPNYDGAYAYLVDGTTLTADDKNTEAAGKVALVDGAGALSVVMDNDVDGDGSVTFNDRMYVVYFYSGSTKGANYPQAIRDGVVETMKGYLRADVTGDYQLSILDYNKVAGNQ